MEFEPPILSYDDVRGHAEEFLAEYHAKESVPIPIEEIVEFDFGMEVIPIPGLRAEVGVDAFLASDLRSISVDEDVLRTHLAEGLAGEFEVSEQTMVIRLEKDGLLPALSRD